MPAVRVRAFAKLNLSLEVLNRRPDGFHNLRTVFQTISLADVLDVEASRTRTTSISLECKTEIAGENLVLRAAHEVLDAVGVRASVRFRLEKRIPMGAGLGGGSSDAAAVLLSLPGLLGKRLPHRQLVEIGSRLGSDVPVFLMGGTVLGLGRGTELYPLPDLPALPVLLIAPGVHVSTAEAYRSLNRSETFEATGSAAEQVAFGLATGQDWAGACVNDFEEAVFARHPEIAAIRRKLERCGASPARMTGSGSAVFGIFPSRQERDEAALQFPKVQTFRVSLLPRRKYGNMRLVPPPGA